MAQRRSPNRVGEHRLCGIYFRFEYYYPRKDVRVIPDEEDLKNSGPFAVLYAWNAVANWGVRFTQANPGWTVNGESPVETLGED